MKPMKKGLSIALCFMSFGAAAQHTSGTVTYETSVHVNMQDINLPEGLSLPEGLELSIANSSRREKLLYFNSDHSLYENKPEEENDQEARSYQQGDVSIQITGGTQADEKVYRDLKNKKQIRQADLMGKMFLVSGETEAPAWKMTGKQKMILNMPAMEAQAINGEDTLFAWYTTSIPLSTGPDVFHGLPGLILELNSGHVLMKAIDFKPGDVNNNKIKAPTKGKKIEARAFAKLQEEKHREMMQEAGEAENGNGVIMRTVITR
jgi:GLPGLI family protein